LIISIHIHIHIQPQMQTFFEDSTVNVPCEYISNCRVYNTACKRTTVNLVHDASTHPWKWVVYFLATHVFGGKEIAVESLRDIQDGVYKTYCYAIKTMAPKCAIKPWQSTKWLHAINIVKYLLVDTDEKETKLRFYLKLHPDVFRVVSALFSQTPENLLFYMPWERIEQTILTVRQKISRYVPVTILVPISSFDLDPEAMYNDEEIETAYIELHRMFNLSLHNIQAASEILLSSVNYGDTAAEMATRKLIKVSDQCVAVKAYLETRECSGIDYQDMMTKVEQIRAHSLYYLYCALYQLDLMEEAYIYLKMADNSASQLYAQTDIKLLSAIKTAMMRMEIFVVNANKQSNK
jgi:hypothetical protein